MAEVARRLRRRLLLGIEPCGLSLGILSAVVRRWPQVAWVLHGSHLNVPSRFPCRVALDHMVGGPARFWQILRGQLRRLVGSDAERVTPQVNELPASSRIVGHDVGDETVVIIHLPEAASSELQCPRHFIPLAEWALSNPLGLPAARGNAFSGGNTVTSAARRDRTRPYTNRPIRPPVLPMFVW